MSECEPRFVISGGVFGVTSGRFVVGGGIVRRLSFVGWSRGGRRAEFLLSLGELGDDFRDLALPGPPRADGLDSNLQKE